MLFFDPFSDESFSWLKSGDFVELLPVKFDPYGALQLAEPIVKLLSFPQGLLFDFCTPNSNVFSV